MNTLEVGRRMSEQWWTAPRSRLGFPRERWLALDPIVRRAVKTGFWLIVGIILVAIGGVWNLTVARRGRDRLPARRHPVGALIRGGQSEVDRRASLLVLAIALPVLSRRSASGCRSSGPFAADGHDGRDDDLHDDGARPELRRRLRGTARPRLRRVLRDGRVHGGLVRVVAVRDAQTPLRRRRPHSGRGRLPLLDLADPAAGGDRHRARRRR